jgi:hypothetical protein
MPADETAASSSSPSLVEERADVLCDDSQVTATIGTSKEKKSKKAKRLEKEAHKEAEV